MLEYSVDDIERMQRNAERRMKNMQECSRAHIDKGNGQPPAPPAPPPPAETPAPKPPSVKRTNILDMLNFKGMEMDSDRSLIIMLMLMLNSNGSDQLLMLALIYIML